MEEEWKDILGFEGLYKVSSNGNVKSTHYKKERIIHPIKHKNGYLYVNLCKNNHYKHYYIHRLVYSAFNSVIPDGMEVNHIDECKINNTVGNLNLMTKQENINYGTRKERSSLSQKMSVIQYDLQGNVINIFKGIRDAAKTLNLSAGNISMCCQNKWKQYKGFIFKYNTENQTTLVDVLS